MSQEAPIALAPFCKAEHSNHANPSERVTFSRSSKFKMIVIWHKQEGVQPSQSIQTLMREAVIQLTLSVEKEAKCLFFLFSSI